MFNVFCDPLMNRKGVPIRYEDRPVLKVKFSSIITFIDIKVCKHLVDPK